MYFVTTQPASTARHIARAAQTKIRQKTGLRVNLLMQIEHMHKTPQRMLHVIALALDMSPDCYRLKSRIRNIVEMRFIAALFLRQHYPMLTLEDIARLFGGQDHTSVMSGLARAYDLIHTEDQRFLKKYNTALKSVNLWLKGAE
jgi:chromosomal replication initiation ATPase DnaA